MATPKDFGFNEDINMLKDSYARFLSEQATIEKLRPSLEGTEDPYHGQPRVPFLTRITGIKPSHLACTRLPYQKTKAASAWDWSPPPRSLRKSVATP